VNPVAMGDSLHFSSVTLLDKVNSYYALGTSSMSTAFLNLTFDLYEQGRREILEKCRLAGKQHKLTTEEVLNFYNEGIRQIKETQRKFNVETVNGTSLDGLRKWNNILSAKLGVKRTILPDN
jgi:hypothetical protein